MFDQRLRILVIDDDATITQLIAEALGCAFDVTAVHDVDHGTAALVGVVPHLLLCDLILERGTSRAFLVHVAHVSPATRRVLMTGSPPHEWSDLVADGVVAAVLVKPFELAQLWRIARLALQAPG